MEKQPETNNRVQITKAVFDGLEFIRSSGATNMLDRPMVINLAREWDFHETADWIESVDTRTYGRLIFQGPEVIENDLTNLAMDNDLSNHAIENDLANQVIEGDPTDQSMEYDFTNQAMDDERAVVRDMIINLGKQAYLTIANTHETEQIGVLIDPSHRKLLNAERNALIMNLAEASNRWLQLEETTTEVRRGIKSLQHMIDPENN